MEHKTIKNENADELGKSLWASLLPVMAQEIKRKQQKREVESDKKSTAKNGKKNRETNQDNS